MTCQFEIIKKGNSKSFRISNFPKLYSIVYVLSYLLPFGLGGAIMAAKEEEDPPN